MFLGLCYPGADPGFQVRGAHLKKIAPSGGRCENSWGISCEKSRFNAKKSYFFQLCAPLPLWIRPCYLEYDKDHRGRW